MTRQRHTERETCKRGTRCDYRDIHGTASSRATIVEVDRREALPEQDSWPCARVQDWPRTIRPSRSSSPRPIVVSTVHESFSDQGLVHGQTNEASSVMFPRSIRVQSKTRPTYKQPDAEWLTRPCLARHTLHAPRYARSGMYSSHFDPHYSLDRSTA